MNFYDNLNAKNVFHFFEEISYYEDFLTNKYDPIKTGLTFDS